MSKSPATLQNLLRRAVNPRLDLDKLGGEKMKSFLEPFLGSSAAQKLRIEERRRTVKQLFAEPARLRQGADDLPEPERQVLHICQRYGGAVTGGVLLAEVLARGMVKPAEEPVRYYEHRKADPIMKLCGRMFLVSWDGLYINDYGYGYAYHGGQLRYPDVALLPPLKDIVEPAAPLSWPQPPAAVPAAVQFRPAAEVAFDLWVVAHALAENGVWKTIKGGSLPKTMQNRVRKALGDVTGEPPTPPDVESLYYELLRGLDAIDLNQGEGRVDLRAVQRHLDRPAVQQCWRLVQAWMHTTLWQDGIGVVPDRDYYNDTVRILPQVLSDAKELVVWVLQRVAHGPNDWLDLTAFLVAFAEVTHNAVDFYWSDYSWAPPLQETESKGQLRELQGRRSHYWLRREGLWVANAIVGTLGHLGLVERGDVETRPCFRLTPLGQAVFAAPEASPLPETTAQFLTVQPNHEIVAYLNVADAADVWPLARMAQRVSTTAGLVQTFALTRDSVYQALESGLTLEQLRRFLSEHSTTGLPANVAISLAEWGRKREALTLRTGVNLLVAPSEPAVLLAKPADTGKKPEVVVNHSLPPAPSWHVKEDGRVALNAEADALALARLSQFASADGAAWRITAESARRAREHGVRADQILGWIAQHSGTPVPPLLETMIRNWTDGGGVFLGELLLLQAPQEQACAVLREHPRFRPYFVAHISPNWFVVREEKRRELEKLLQELGFATDVAWKPPTAKKNEPEKPPPRKKRQRR